MKTKKLACLSLAVLTISAVSFAGTRPDLRYAQKEHISTLQLYQMGHPSAAINENVGKFVTLDVTVTYDQTTERATPLVQIIMPQEFKKGLGTVQHPISAHLEGSDNDVKELKQGDRAKIEGIIVNEGYGAYFVYVLSVFDVVKPKPAPPQ